MNNKKTKVLSLLLAVLMLTGVFSGLMITSSAVSDDENADNPYGLLDNVEGGIILHCWCWSFNTIKENMETIAKSGYSAIQTSPINAVYEGDGGGLKINGDDADGKWYYHYQPVAYTIGNYQLGTEEEFKAMCETAHSYGVKVIVDVVANHTSPSKSAVSYDLRNIKGGLYHDYNGAADPDSRKSMTQWYQGLPDVNTQNENYQKLILDYLKNCVADGADGFRYDTAKHIELPDDDPEFASEFWPTVLDNGSSFQYGEVLQGTNSKETESSRFPDYADIMHVTASSYGAFLRTFLSKYDTSAKGLGNYYSEKVSDDRLVTWVESHDTYANGGASGSSATSFWLTNSEIRKGWAIVAARGTTSLFFSRPDGSSPDNVFGNNLIGPAGDDNYFNEEVVAINHFHNAMTGESAEMKNLKGKKYIMITRGTKGAVIANCDTTKDLVVSTDTTLLDGTYTDTAHNSTFIVKDGVLTGTVKADEIVVIDNLDSAHYNPEIIEPTTEEPTTEEITTEEPTEEPTVEIPTETEITTDPVSTDAPTVSPEPTQVVKPTIEPTPSSAAKVKKANPVKVTVNKKSVKAKKLKSKKQTVKVLKIKNAQGAVTVAKVKKGTAKKIYKKIKVNSKTGAVTFKKGKYAKKTYKIKLKISVKGNTLYNSKALFKTVKVKVK